MNIITYTDLRKNLATAMDQVIKDSAPLLITRQNEEPTVLISLKDFNAYEETAYLLKSHKNAQRIRESIEQMKTGQAAEQALHDSIDNK